MNSIEAVTTSTVESTIETRPADRSGGWVAFWRHWGFWVGFVPGLMMLPMLALQAQTMWVRPQLRFSLCVVVVVGILSGFRMASNRATQHPVRWWTAIGFLVASTVLYSWAVWSFSPWLAHAAAIGIFLAWALGSWGNCTCAHIGATALFLVTTLPWPMNWDLQFDGWLKQTAASYASSTLDTFNLPNLLSDGKLQTELLRIETAELTSYGSVFALIAWGCALCLLRQRGLLHGIFLTISAPFVSMVTSFLALCLIVHFAHQHGIVLIPEHWFALHLVLLLVGVFFIALIDVCLAFLFRPVPVTEPDFFAIFSFGNKVLCWPYEDPQESIVPDDPDDRELYEQRKLGEELNRKVWPLTDWRDHMATRWPVYVAVLFVIAAGVPPILLHVRGDLLAQAVAFRTPTVDELNGDYPGTDTLPQRIGSWQQVGFSSSAGEVANLEWQYTWRGQRVTARVSFPHTSSVVQLQVRAGEGWKTMGETSLTDDKGLDSLQFSQWVNKLGGKTYLIASALDSRLQPRSKFEEVRKSRNRQTSPIMAKLYPERLRATELSCWLTAECEPGLELRDEQLRDFQVSFEAFRAAVAAALPRDSLEQLVSSENRREL